MRGCTCSLKPHRATLPIVSMMFARVGLTGRRAGPKKSFASNRVGGKNSASDGMDVEATVAAFKKRNRAHFIVGPSRSRLIGLFESFVLVLCRVPRCDSLDPTVAG